MSTAEKRLMAYEILFLILQHVFLTLTDVVGALMGPMVPVLRAGGGEHRCKTSSDLLSNAT